MPTVIVSGQRLMMPRICACCGRPPTTTIEDSGFHNADRPRRDKSFEFPVCDHCLRHSKDETSFFTRSSFRSPECEGGKRIVDYVSWRGTEHTIRFDSLRYARAFAEANQAGGKSVLRFDAAGAPLVQNPTGSGFAPVPKSRAPIVLLVLLLAIASVCMVAESLQQPPDAGVPRVYAAPTTEPPKPPTPAIDLAPQRDAGHRHHSSHRR